MSNLKMNIPHHLKQEEAQQRIQSLLGQVQAKFGSQVHDVNQDWQGNTGNFSFKVMNMPVSGKLVVKDSDIELDGQLPMAVSMFQGKIKSVILEEAKKILG